MKLFDFFRRKKKNEVTIETQMIPEKPTVFPRKGVASGHLEEIDSHSVPELQKQFFAFDVETTGLNPQTDRIVEIGVVEFANGKSVRKFSTLVNPGMPISVDATAVNHITNEMVSGAPPEETVYPKLIEFFGDAMHGGIMVCAHNARFDIDFLCNTLSRLGYDAKISYVDTLMLSRRQISGLTNYKQETIAKYYGIECGEEHRASSDAEVCGQILVRLLSGKEEELEQKRKRIEELCPQGEELEVCAVIQNAIETVNGDASYLRFKKGASHVNAYCFYPLMIIKTAKKGKYITVLKSAAINCGLPMEPCPASEGGADWVRVYFNDPFALEPLYGFFVDHYKKRYDEMQEYISLNKSCRQAVMDYLRESKSIGKDEMLSLLDSARARSYEKIDVKVEKPVTKADVFIRAQNNRCPLSEIRNNNDWDAGFRDGSPYYFSGEEKRKAGQLEEAIQLFDLARYHGYEAPALYDSYAKTYRSMKDYDNEIEIIEEFLKRKTYGKEGVFRTRRDSALKLLYSKQEAERKAAQKSLEAEAKKKEKAEKETNISSSRQSKGRPILQLNDNGEIIKEYVSISAAVSETGINSKSIRDAANGVQKHAGGYCWKYKENDV